VFANLHFGSILSWLLFLVLFSFLIIKKSSIYSNSLLVFSFFLLGGLLSGVRKSNQFLESYKDHKLVVLSHVVEVSRSKSEWNKCIFEVEKIIENKSIKASKERILVYVKDELEVGQIVLANLDLFRIKNGNNPGEFNAESYWRNKGFSHMGFLHSEDYKLIDFMPENGVLDFFHKTRNYLLNLIEEKVDEKYQGIAQALLLGEKGNLTSEIRDSFSAAGAMHVLAVSGLHIGILMMLLSNFLSLFTRYISQRNAIIITILVAWIYASLTGFSPSILRATLMFSILLMGVFLGRRSNSLNGLGLSAFILILIEPSYIFDIGFQLSYLAVIGILIFHGPITKLVFFENKFLRKIWEGTSVGLAAQIFTFPLMLYYFGQFPNYFVLSNLVVMIIAGVILGLGILFFTFSKIPFVGAAITYLLGLTIAVLLFSMQFIESIPGSLASGFTLNIVQVLFLYFLIFASLFFGKKVKFQFKLAIIFVFILAWIQFDRFSNLNEEHLVFFNSKTTLFAIKERGKTYCFYEKKNGFNSSEKNILKDYKKKFGGVVKLIPLEEKVYDIKLSNKKIVTLKNGNSSAEIVFANEKYLLRKSYQFQGISKAHVIDMPYLGDNYEFDNLRNGAVFISI